MFLDYIFDYLEKTKTKKQHYIQNLFIFKYVLDQIFHPSFAVF